MSGGHHVCSIAVSRDGKWIVDGTGGGQAAVWSAENREKVSEFKGHGNGRVFAVDISPDSGWLRSKFHPTDSSSPPPCGRASPFGSTTVAMAASSLTV